jgi:hypothetical protein
MARTSAWRLGALILRLRLPLLILSAMVFGVSAFVLPRQFTTGVIGEGVEQYALDAAVISFLIVTFAAWSLTSRAE